MTSSNTLEIDPTGQIKKAVLRDGVLKATLCHRSARAKALVVLREHNYPPAILEPWLNIGQAVVALYAARGVITALRTGSAGDASLMMQTIDPLLELRLAQTFSASNLAKFGDGMSESERLSPAACVDIVYRFVGCHSFLWGYRETINQLLCPLAPLEGIRLQSKKDSKTSLQELTQGRRLGTPEYMLIETLGPPHCQVFRVAVTVKKSGRAEGEGRSKRLAEQAAAQAFIDRNRVSLAAPRATVLRPDLDVAELAAKMPKLPNAKAVKALSDQLEIPEWGSNLLSLALVHASYGSKQQNDFFGKNNQILAFLGSRALQWAAKDCLLKEAGVRAVAEVGGLAALYAASQAPEKLGSAYPEILNPSLLLLGKGEKVLLPSLKVEFLQAFTGALFLSREKSLDTSFDLFKHVPSLIAYFSDLAKSKKSKDDTFSPKTLLQERFQPIGVFIDYETKNSNGRTITVETAVRFRSRHENRQDLRISFPKQQFDASAFRGKAVLEAKIANVLINTFDRVFGGTERESPANVIFSEIVQRWLLNSLLQEIRELQMTNNQLRLTRLARSDIAGFGALRRSDFGDFESWVRRAHSLVGENDSSTIKALSDLYAQSYRDRSSKKLVARLLSELEHMHFSLKQIDPLTAVGGIQDTPEFSSLVQFAMAFKVVSRQIVKITLTEFVAQAEILFRRRGCMIGITGDDHGEIIEIQGSHLGLLEMLARCSEELGLSECKITISDEGGFLSVQLEKSPEVIADYLDRLSENPMWLSLSRLLPITGIFESTSLFRVLVPSLASDSVRILAMNYWWAYYQRGAIDRSVNDSIAILLHDMKNELLAFDEAASRARKSDEKRARYQLAADASSHLDQAVGKIASLRALAQSSNSFEFELLDIEQFIRSLIQETWSRVPAGIIFTPPKSMSKATIWTSETELRSILVNLVRNSLEALNGHGRLSFDYTVDVSRKLILFELIDSGSGFSPDQLSRLNRGVAIDSTKRSGPGIGLLTVLLLTKELCGRVLFSAAPSGAGCRIVLEIPSVEPMETNSPPVDIIDDNYLESVEKAVIN